MSFRNWVSGNWNWRYEAIRTSIAFTDDRCSTLVVMVVVRWNICYSSGWMVVCGQNGDENGVKMVWGMLVMADESER